MRFSPGAGEEVAIIRLIQQEKERFSQFRCQRSHGLERISKLFTTRLVAADALGISLHPDWHCSMPTGFEFLALAIGKLVIDSSPMG